MELTTQHGHLYRSPWQIWGKLLADLLELEALDRKKDRMKRFAERPWQNPRVKSNVRVDSDGRSGSLKGRRDFGETPGRMEEEDCCLMIDFCLDMTLS